MATRTSPGMSPDTGSCKGAEDELVSWKAKMMRNVLRITKMDKLVYSTGVTLDS